MERKSAGKAAGETVLSESALKVLGQRYLRRSADGEPAESPAALFERVAHAIAEPEGRQRRKWAERFAGLMKGSRFLPNSPTLMNAGTPGGQLSACFVLPIEDSLDSIFGTLRDAAIIHQSGGGTGFDFSRLRPAGSRVRVKHGAASGPVSFIRVYDLATETVKQGGTRRGANMAILRADHPDIFEFVDAKRDGRAISNFNVSVGATAEFMEAARADGDFALRNPGDGSLARTVRARELLDRIVDSAWLCGDPGLVFLDRVNAMNPTPRAGAMESTNPCGEQPLLPYESCNLGSLNVGRYVAGGKVDWERLGEDVDVATRFLDNVIECNHFPIPECRAITLKNRKIGLGVMGFADLLLELGLPYASAEAVAFGERLMSFIDRRAKRASARLAQERGAFPNWKGSLWQRLGYPPLRNATVSTVAPTGTISIIAGASGGIEPIFAGILARNVLAGERLVDVHPAVQRAVRSRGARPDALTEAELEDLLGPAWSPAHRVPVEWHIRMQGAFQRHSDSAVSKTVNLPESASRDEVRAAYFRAYELGCKGITVYRDKSRQTQVLEKPADAGGPLPADFCPAC